jgi:molecular chaperone GrpE
VDNVVNEVNELDKTMQEQVSTGNGGKALPLTDEKEVVDVVDSVEEAVERELTLEQQLAAAQAEAARNLEGWQRTQAEFANARKRLERQRAEAYTNASADLANRLLPIVDDFERALKNSPADAQGNGWLSGVELVYRKLINVLEGLGVAPIEAAGQPFDPNLHEALGQEASSQYESGVVTREMQRGYRLGERVIRPSLVYVAE